MIRSLFSSISSFKSPTFRSGLNILVAEKDETNDQKKTRNSAGKTSLVEIIHFVLGASLDEKSIFRYPELAKARFGIDFDIRGKPVKAVRSVENHGQIVIQDGDTSQWPIEPSLDRTSGERIMPLKDWTSVLGWGMFNLPTLSTADGKGRPSFRNLFPYFARRARDAGFHDPTLWGKGVQQADAKRIALSFLLGLDWTIAQRLKQISDQLEHIEVLSRAAKSEGVLSRVMGSDAEVLRELAITEARAKKLEEEVRDFRVIPEYEVLRKEGDQINRRQGDIEGEEMSDSANLAGAEIRIRTNAKSGFP
jgi:uncharacterized protein YydD (DUF2326 family)